VLLPCPVQTVLRILRACRDEYETKYVVRTLIQVSQVQYLELSASQCVFASLKLEALTLHALPMNLLLCVCVCPWVQNLRIGANWKSVVGPLAKAVTITREGLGRCNKVGRSQAGDRLVATAGSICGTRSLLHHICCTCWQMKCQLPTAGPPGRCSSCCLRGLPRVPLLGRAGPCSDGARGGGDQGEVRGKGKGQAQGECCAVSWFVLRSKSCAPLLPNS
jgi:hypothetical protein